MSGEHIASTHVPWLAKRKVLVEFGTDQFGHDLVQCAAYRVDLVKPGGRHFLTCLSNRQIIFLSPNLCNSDDLKHNDRYIMEWFLPSQPVEVDEEGEQIKNT